MSKVFIYRRDERDWQFMAASMSEALTKMADECRCDSTIILPSVHRAVREFFQLVHGSIFHDVTCDSVDTSAHYCIGCNAIRATVGGDLDRTALNRTLQAYAASAELLFENSRPLNEEEVVMCRSLASFFLFIYQQGAEKDYEQFVGGSECM